jgi:hypothetical protein
MGLMAQLGLVLVQLDLTANPGILDHQVLKGSLDYLEHWFLGLSDQLDTKDQLAQPVTKGI